MSSVLYQLAAPPTQWRLDQLARDLAPLYDDLCAGFDDVMTRVDMDKLCGSEREVFECGPRSRQLMSRASREEGASEKVSPDQAQRRDSDKAKERDREKEKRKKQKQEAKKQQSSPPSPPQPTQNLAASVLSGNYFSKADLYANSRLPASLPPLALYTPTWPLVCLAAQYSTSVYAPAAAPSERADHVSSSWLGGTKAMVIKSVPMDHMQALVFAVRGTASFADWAVNLRSAPESPAGFLDDPGNLCHAGFLAVARRMVRPVARRLRALLDEDPARRHCSLLITGHSAGGAVASLLYCHMLAASPEARSELSVLAGSFRRVHCVTFGTPPVSLLPLATPPRPDLANSLFLSFVNEGDPVARADKAYVKSLLELLASPPPPPSAPSATAIWPVPVAPLSNAGRLVLLRSGRAAPAATRGGGGGGGEDRRSVRDRLDEGVVAVTCADEDLRGVIWGDPVCHLMSLYAGRVEVLAVGAVTMKKGPFW